MVVGFKKSASMLSWLPLTTVRQLFSLLPKAVNADNGSLVLDGSTFGCLSAFSFVVFVMISVDLLAVFG
jgi:hypothetical protein